MDVFGAGLLARALAWESPVEFVGSQLGGYAEIQREMRHGADQAEARLGALLLIAGFLGQLVGAFQADWPRWFDVAAVSAAAMSVVVVLAARKRYIRRWQGRVFMARARDVDRLGEIEAAKRRDAGLPRSGRGGSLTVAFQYLDELKLRGRVPETLPRISKRLKVLDSSRPSAGELEWLLEEFRLPIPDREWFREQLRIADEIAEESEMPPEFDEHGNLRPGFGPPR